MLIRRQSILDGKMYEMQIDITEKQWEDYTRSDQLIQHAFPHLSKDEREFLISGITPYEWERVFGEDDLLE